MAEDATDSGARLSRCELEYPRPIIGNENLTRATRSPCTMRRNVDVTNTGHAAELAVTARAGSVENAWRWPSMRKKVPPIAGILEGRFKV